MLVLGFGLPARAQTNDADRQLPADQVAYRAAMATADPEARLKALRTFSVEYQDSKYFDSVQEAALRLLLRSFPTRTAEIRDQVQVNVSNADKGYQRWREQSNEAALLADAGVLLPLAQKLAEDSQRNLTEATFLRGMARMYGELQSEMPTPEELHGQYTEARAATLLALAAVYVRQKNATLARPLLDKVTALQPWSAQLHALRGELLLQDGHTPEALEQMEQAALLGDVTARQRTLLLEMYKGAHGGNAEGLQGDLDRVYASLRPVPFTPPARTPSTPGHTVLVELFTGAGCLPCAGADAAVETLLETYSSSEAVLLEWDQHTPEPDPLANPASGKRAEVMGVGNTPVYFLDGKRMPLYGATREGAAEVYTGLTRLLGVQEARPSGVHLQLAATRGSDGVLQATATVREDKAAMLQAATAEELAPWPGDSIAVASRSREAAAFPPQLVVNFALVEDNVRYSGENGVRVHRMVVRATGSDPAWGSPLHPGKAETFEQSFDPVAVKRSLQDYLLSFEKGNELFGPVEFLSREVSMDPKKLGIVAWVQDTRTHRVVQAAFTTVAER